MNSRRLFRVPETESVDFMVICHDLQVIMNHSTQIRASSWQLQVKVKSRWLFYAIGGRRRDEVRQFVRLCTWTKATTLRIRPFLRSLTSMTLR